jgi:uncharacterized protein (TIGR02466 family)
MKSSVHPLFPVAAMEFDNFPITDKEIDKLIRDQDFESMQIENGLVSSEKYLLNLKKNSSLRRNLFHCVDQYTHNILDIRHSVSFYFQNSWMMKHRPGDWGQNHIHENSLISGVLYLRVPPNSGDLILHRNRIVSNFINPYINLPARRPNIYNADNFVCRLADRKLVLFPANMNHSIGKNESGEDRYCIAFNVFFKGMLGEETSVCSIQ